MQQQTPAELWHQLPRHIREKITKQAGFGDYRTYASYRWNQFQPHTREYLAKKIQLEADALTGFNRCENCE